jgi:hypothetical protein
MKSRNDQVEEIMTEMEKETKQQKKRGKSWKICSDFQEFLTV